MEQKQKRIVMLESSLKELRDKYAKVVQQNEMLHIHVEAGDSKGRLEAELTKVMKERDAFQSENVNVRLEAKSAKEKASYFLSFEEMSVPLSFFRFPCLRKR